MNLFIVGENNETKIFIHVLNEVTLRVVEEQLLNL